MPRNVHPDCSTVSGAHCFNVDDLKLVVSFHSCTSVIKFGRLMVTIPLGGAQHREEKKRNDRSRTHSTRRAGAVQTVAAVARYSYLIALNTLQCISYPHICFLFSGAIPTIAKLQEKAETMRLEEMNKVYLPPLV